MSDLIGLPSKKGTLEILAKKNRYGLKPWKRCKDASAIPDRGFRKQLKCLNNTLEPVWDSISCNWEIWSFPDNGQEPYMIMRVGQPKNYEELSQKVLLQMQRNIFFTNNLTPKQVCDYLEEYETQRRRKREEAFRQKIRDIAIDTRAFSQNVLQIQVPRSEAIKGAIINATK